MENIPLMLSTETFEMIYVPPPKRILNSSNSALLRFNCGRDFLFHYEFHLSYSSHVTSLIFVVKRHRLVSQIVKTQ